MTPSREEILADGRVCCLLNLSCCNPPGDIVAREMALAEVIYGFAELPQLDAPPKWAHACAKTLMQVVDFVPPGAAEYAVAIAEAYRENLEKTRKKSGK